MYQPATTYAAHRERVRAANPIEEVIGEYTQLHRSGRELLGLSPLTSEKNPSLYVNPEKQVWFDYSSGNGGDVIRFVELIGGVTHKEAVAFLGRKAGIDPPHWTPEQKAAMEAQVNIEEIRGESAAYYHARLSEETRARIRSERNFTDETIDRFMLGEAKGGLWPHLKSKGISEDDAIAAGVVKRTDEGKIRDYFWQRLIIPNFVHGRCVHMTGRSLHDSSPKYLHISGPKTHLFNEDALKSEAVIICEGPMDVIALEQAGFPAVGLMGLSLKPEHVKRFSR